MQIESYKLYSNYLGWHSTLQWPKSKNSCLQKKIQHTPDPEGLQKKQTNKPKKPNKTLEQFTKWPSGLQIYLHNCWKAFRSYFCDESNVTWRGEIRVLIVIKQTGLTDLMVAKLSWKKFHLSNGIYIHLTHERKILSIK